MLSVGGTLIVLDLHPDPFYKVHSMVDKNDACHRGKGPAGFLGAETTDCDSPLSLINATFTWIDENIKDQIDFVVWTGDSARHDNDEKIPRTDAQVTVLNTMMVSKFEEVFGEHGPTSSLRIPIIPTWGNNDIIPHNIFPPGPNKWTKEYLNVWKKFIPEEQRHGFVEGGWFFVEVIPNQLAVFSINTLCFFDSNSAVDGCSDRSEPGYQQFEWLRVQLRFLRLRGMKAILTGHVPPARTANKMNWDETCWQKYTLWVHQFRDVIVGSMYGHMNIDHFLLQDHEEVNLLQSGVENLNARAALDDEVTAQRGVVYLTDLRTGWSSLPTDPDHEQDMLEESEAVDANSLVEIGAEKKKDKKSKKKKREDYLKKIGGPWAERYSLSLISPSLVPNYFPTIRIVQYNITGLENAPTWATETGKRTARPEGLETVLAEEAEDDSLADGIRATSTESDGIVQKSTRRKFKVPKGPSKSAPPGPAYSPQTLTFTGYTQLFANLTTINNDFPHEDEATASQGDFVELQRWKDGKHSGKKPNTGLRPKTFRFEVEYDTANDTIWDLKDLTVRNYLDLASRMGRYKPRTGDRFPVLDDQGRDAVEPAAPAPPAGQAWSESEHDCNSATKKRKKKGKGKKGKGKKTKRKAINRVWFAFVRRAFVGAVDDADLHQQFGQPVQELTGGSSDVASEDASEGAGSGLAGEGGM
jgi:endopolyphosphatase